MSFGVTPARAPLGVAVALPATIGAYRVDRLLGSGGMGVVVLCHDAQLQRAVALKFLRPELSAQPEMRERFVREARALARVHSPYVVSIHAVGDDAVVGPYVVMELLDGEDLAVRIARVGRVAWREACIWAADACAGLQAAKDAGLIHRDVKPANLCVVPHAGSTRVKLTDFGLAREDNGTGARVTAVGIVVGTPAYLAPEVVRGEQHTALSDVYALGATLFHLIAGEPPFPGDAPLMVLADAVNKAAPRLKDTVADVPDELSALVDAMLAKQPASRPGNLDIVGRQLAALHAPPAGAATRSNDAIYRTQTMGSLPPLSTSGLAPLVSSPAVLHLWGAHDASAPALAATAQTSTALPVPWRVTLRLRALPWRVKAMALTAVVVLVVGIAVALHDSRRDRIAAGRAKDVLAEIDAIAERDRDDDDWLDRGFAFLSIGAPKRAFASFLAAAKLGNTDNDVRDACLSALTLSDDNGAVEVLAAWKDDAVVARLQSAVVDEAFSLRHHALDVLEARDLATDDQRISVALKDAAANDCAQRRAGLLLLKRAGKGQAALSAAMKLKNDMPRNLCMVLDAGGAVDAIRKRVDEH